MHTSSHLLGGTSILLPPSQTLGPGCSLQGRPPLMHCTAVDLNMQVAFCRSKHQTVPVLPQLLELHHAESACG